MTAMESVETILQNDSSLEGYVSQAHGMMDDLTNQLTAEAFKILSPHEQVVHIVQVQKKAAEDMQNMLSSIDTTNMDRNDKSIKITYCL